MHVTHLQL